MDQQFLLKPGLTSVHVNAIQIELSKYRFATNPRGCSSTDATTGIFVTSLHTVPFHELYTRCFKICIMQYNTAAHVVQHGSRVVQHGPSCRTTRPLMSYNTALMSYNTTYQLFDISDGGNVWMWGTNEFGQLGTEDDFTMISKPCKLQISVDKR